VAVCNFALLDDNFGAALVAICAVLRPGGTLIIQTVHPFTSCGDGPCVDGWREVTFDAFGGRLASAMAWYFRTIASWLAELQSTGFVLDSVTEPRATDAPRPLSLLISARRAVELSHEARVSIAQFALCSRT